MLLFKRSKRWRQKASLRRVLIPQLVILQDCWKNWSSVLRQNTGFKPVLKTSALNLVSSSLGSSFLVDYFWLRQNYFHLTTLLKCLIAISMSDWTDSWDGSRMNQSEVPLHICCTSLWVFYKYEEWERPWPIKKRRLRLINNYKRVRFSSVFL